MRWYELGLTNEVAEALEREARKRNHTPVTLIEIILRDYLVSKGNLRIY